MAYKILFSSVARKYISQIPESELPHVKAVILLCLGEYLKKVSKRCNKKIIKGSKEHVRRLHISMKYTIFYRVDDENEVVFVDDMMGINQAHSKYSVV